MTSSPQPPPPGGQPPQYGQQPGYGPSGPGQPGPGHPQGPGQPGYPPPAYGQQPPAGYGQQPPAGYGQQPPPGYGPPPGTGPYGAPTGGSGVSFDLKKLRMADYVVAAGAIVYLILAVLPWYSVDFGDAFGVDVPGDSVTLSGFSYSGLVSFSFVLFLLAAVWALLPAFTDLKLGFPRGWVTVGLAALGLLLTLFAWIRSLSDSGFEIAPLLGLITAAAITVFAFLGLLPELRNKPALPGALAGAAQWANQQAPAFGQGGTGPGTGAPGGPAAPYPPGGPGAPSPTTYGQPGGQPVPPPPPVPGPSGPSSPPYGPPPGGPAPGAGGSTSASGPEHPTSV